MSAELTTTPWARLREESDLDFGHFTLWLALNPRPQSIDPTLALKHNWAERAAAFDSYQLVCGLTPKETAAQIFRMWSLVVANETRKWLAKSLREQREPSLEPARIGDFIDLVTDPARNQAGRPTHNLSKLAPERLALFLEILEEVKETE